MNLSDLITPKKAARLLHWHYRTILKRIRQGEIPVVRLGRTFLINKQELTQHLEREQNSQPLKIAVAIVRSHNKFLLIQRRHKELGLSWQFPAGRIRFNEHSKLRAQIECLEETGVTCLPRKFLGSRIHPDTRVTIFYWLCDFLTGKANNIDHTENKKVEWVDQDKVLSRFTTDTFPAIKKLLTN